MEFRQALTDFLDYYPCLQLSEAPEIFGPTAINAQSGNQSLSVGLDRNGTVTVFRWPRPSFYDQIKHCTTSRDEPRMGARPNEGAFLGLVWTQHGERETSWLRDWDAEQRYADDHSDTIVTTYRAPTLGLTVSVTDVVAASSDVLFRDVTVERDPDSSIESIGLLAYEHFNPVVTKEPRAPVQDWCFEATHTNEATYHSTADAITHSATGTDASTGESRRVATAMGLDSQSSQFQVGGDSHEPAVDSPPPSATDAFEAATTGRLQGNDSYEGQTTGALLTPLEFERGTASEIVYLCAGETTETALDLLQTARHREVAAVREAKREFYDDLVGDAPMPDTDTPAIRSLARRALVTLVSNYDPESGAIVASIATQSPYALDWPRDGAYFNHVLGLLGLDSWVENRNRWYASLQVRDGPAASDGHDGTPPGHWAMNYYADGVVGGPIPWEIDQTGYLLWTFWEQYRRTKDMEYLDDVYPAIERAADALCAHREPSTGLHEPAHEDDNVVPSQTIVGAGPIWLGLECATKAAEAYGADAAAERYRERRIELGAAIDDQLWDETEGAYSGGSPDMELCHTAVLRSDLVAGFPLVPGATANASLYWPIGFESSVEGRMERHLEGIWRSVSPSFEEPARGRQFAGLYETKSLLTLARAWRGTDRMNKVREGIRWVATQHATSDTQVMGEFWLRDGEEILTSVSQPHVWSQLLCYYASLEAFPPGGLDELEDDESVIEHLRAQSRTQ